MADESWKEKLVRKGATGCHSLWRAQSPSLTDSCPADLQTNCCHESRCSLRRIESLRILPALLQLRVLPAHVCSLSASGSHPLTSAAPRHPCLMPVFGAFKLVAKQGGQAGRKILCLNRQRPEYTRYCLCLFYEDSMIHRARGELLDAVTTAPPSPSLTTPPLSQLLR